MTSVAKLLIFSISGAICLGGCASTPKPQERTPSLLEQMPFVYRMDIQQGNVVTQEMLDRVQLGMTRAQVRLALGTPLLVDVFHPDRWDYIYTLKRRGEDQGQQVISLFFRNDRLDDLQGLPRGEWQAFRTEKDQAVVVPDGSAPKKGIISRMLGTLGVEIDDRDSGDTVKPQPQPGSPPPRSR
ncbi:outer membrane protein assembly factor BamE [Gammaproteobacteria bacterium]